MTDVARSAATRFRFADLVLDVGSRRVARDGQEIELPKLSFDLLSALVTAAPDALSIDQLIERVWNGSIVSSATVAKRVELLRHALSDDSQNPRYIGLIRGHGYRLIPDVAVQAVAAQVTVQPGAERPLRPGYLIVAVALLGVLL